MAPSTRRYGPNSRWLLKALREVAHEIAELASGPGGEALTRRPAPSGLREPWSIVELVAFLRDSEAEDLRAVRRLCARDGAPLPERRAHLGPGERPRRADDLPGLLHGFLELRGELLWTLREAGPAWRHAGVHPHRGEVTLGRYVHEIAERDLDALWSLRRLREEEEAALPALPR